MRKIFICLIISQFAVFSNAQKTDSLNQPEILYKDSLIELVNQFAHQLNKDYQNYKEQSLKIRRIKQDELLPLIQNISKNPMFTVNKLGKSVQNKNIYLLKVGSGSVKVLLWSQMHGNEPTATQALFDIFNFLTSKFSSPEVQLITKKLSLYFIPMLNPDGAEQFKRRTAINIDMNRDALRLSCPEAKILKNLRDSLKADYGFNLHDQNSYYGVGNTEKVSSLSFLAPAYNFSEDINDIRKKSMQTIVLLNKLMQQFIPGQIGRYGADFMPTSLGDNMQKWGTSAILIESGAFQNDPERQTVRKMNFIAILSALYGISLQAINVLDYKKYFEIPLNKSQVLSDFIIRKVWMKNADYQYKADISIKNAEIDNSNHTTFRIQSRINDIGDMSFKKGFKELDAEGLFAEEGKIYPKVIKRKAKLMKLNFQELLKQGYLYLKVPSRLLKTKNIPLILTDRSKKLKPSIRLGGPANFILKNKQGVKYTVINGFCVNLGTVQ